MTGQVDDEFTRFVGARLGAMRRRSQVGGLLTVFSHLRLLGPDVANWTRQPLR